MATTAEVDVEAINESAVIQKVHIDELQIDMSYQRVVSQRMVDQIAADWSIVASELILVSDRGPRDPESGVRGGLFIINGQHRTNAARKLKLDTMDARVIDLSMFDDPAAVEAKFRLETNVRINDRPTERFRAQVRSGDPQSLAIVQLLSRFDTEINMTPGGETGLNTVSGIEKLYAVDKGQLLSQTFGVIRDAFKMVGGKSATVNILNGVAWFILQHDEESDRLRLVERLQEVGIMALDRRARTIQANMTGSLWINYYRAIVEIYNDRLRGSSRLDWKTKGAGNWRGSTEARRGQT